MGDMCSGFVLDVTNKHTIVKSCSPPSKSFRVLVDFFVFSGGAWFLGLISPGEKIHAQELWVDSSIPAGHHVRQIIVVFHIYGYQTIMVNIWLIYG